MNRPWRGGTGAHLLGGGKNPGEVMLLAGLRFDQGVFVRSFVIAIIPPTNDASSFPANRIQGGPSHQSCHQ